MQHCNFVVTYVEPIVCRLSLIRALWTVTDFETGPGIKEGVDDMM